MEDREEYIVKKDSVNKIEASMITVTITESNTVRLHEIVRELVRLEAINRFDAEELLACCEVL
jgi:hypothetical protein